MKYLRLFEDIDIDPFEEEDWDEVDFSNKISIVKYKDKDILYIVMGLVGHNMLYISYLDKGELYIHEGPVENDKFTNFSDKDKDDILEDRIDIKIFFYDKEIDKINIKSMKLSSILDELGMTKDDIIFYRLENGPAYLNI